MGQTKEIAQLAGRIFRVFTEAGMITGALTALAYVQEAASAGRLTSVDLQAVGAFLRRAKRQPELLFEPPPENH